MFSDLQQRSGPLAQGDGGDGEHKHEQRVAGVPLVGGPEDHEDPWRQGEPDEEDRRYCDQEKEPGPSCDVVEAGALAGRLR